MFERNEDYFEPQYAATSLQKHAVRTFGWMTLGLLVTTATAFAVYDDHTEFCATDSDCRTIRCGHRSGGTSDEDVRHKCQDFIPGVLYADRYHLLNACSCIPAGYTGYGVFDDDCVFRKSGCHRIYDENESAPLWTDSLWQLACFDHH